MSATPDTRPDPASLPAWASTTAGRSGASYQQFLAQHPNFDPWTNLETFTGAGGSQDPIVQQAFAWTNNWAKNNGYGDGANIPLAQRQQIFLANLERGHQQWQDNQAAGGQDLRGVTWDSSAASRLPAQNWHYTPGWGLTHGGQSYETQGPTGAGDRAGGASNPGDPGPLYAGPNGATHTPPAGQQGGTTVSAPVPPMGTGLAGAANGQAGSMQAGAAANGAQYAPGAPGLTSAGYEVLTNDPKRAWRYLMQLAGQDPDYQGPFSQYMQSTYAPALASYLQSRLQQGGGAGAMDQVGNFLGDFQHMLGGNQLFGGLAQAGQAGLAAGQGLLNTAPSADAENYLRQMLGLTGMGLGSLGQSAQQALTNKLTAGYDDAALRGQNLQAPTKFGTYLNDSGFLARLRALGLLQ